MKFKLKPKIVIIISVIIGIVMLVSAYFELKQSKAEIFELLFHQATSLSEIVNNSSVNALKSSLEIEELITERLLNNARLIRTLDSLNVLTSEKLIEIGKKNNLFRINIFDKQGNRVLSSRVPDKDHIHPEGIVNRYDEVEPILTNQVNELVIGLKTASFSKEKRYAVAVDRAFNRGAIVINMDAKEFLEFRKKIGLGKTVQDLSDNPGIEYIVLQDSIGILAASNTVTEMSSISSDKFLLTAAYTNLTSQRVTEFNSKEVYEVVKSLYFNEEFIGIFRIGLSLNEIRSVEERMIRRLIIISLILAAISIIVLSIIFTNQSLKSVSTEFNKFKSFTDSILKNMQEAVVIIEKNSTISLFNEAGKELFNFKQSDIVGQKLTDLEDCNISFLLGVVSDQASFKNIEKYLTIDDKEIILDITVTPNFNLARELDSYTIVMTDITESKKIEEQTKRNEKLLAMGELASGVAHEIRNPINSIGMIAQRLNKEFAPSSSQEEYNSITELLRSEVKRINSIITQFLQYAKPLELQKSEVIIEKFFENIYQLYKAQAKQNNVSFKVIGKANIIVKLDPELFKQTIMNIIQNAFDAGWTTRKRNCKIQS